MAELPKTPRRNLDLFGATPPPTGAETLGATMPSYSGESEATPEESLAKFRALGAKAKGAGKLPLDATKIAQALQSITVPHSASGRVSRETVGRSIQLPAEIFDAIESILGDARSIPGFVRDAIKVIAEGRVLPKKLIDQSSEIARARVAGKGKVGLTVTMPKSLYGVVEVLAQRTRLTDKAVMEACAVLYLQAAMEAQKPVVEDLKTAKAD